MNSDLTSYNRGLELDLHAPKTFSGEGGCGRNGQNQIRLSRSLHTNGGRGIVEEAKWLEELEAAEEDGVGEAGRDDHLLVFRGKGVVKCAGAGGRVTELRRLEVAEGGVARGEAEAGHWEEVNEVGGVMWDFGGGALLANVEEGVAERGGGGWGELLTGLDKIFQHSTGSSLSDKLLQLRLIVEAGEVRGHLTKYGEEGWGTGVGKGGGAKDCKEWTKEERELLPTPVLEEFTEQTVHLRQRKSRRKGNFPWWV